jgi:hypothetical protein
MSTVSFGLGLRRAASLPALLASGALIAVAVMFGFATSVGTTMWVATLGVVVFVELAALALAKWQRLVVLLIVYLPYTGVLSLLLYPQTFLGEVARDVFIVTPLYLGLFASRTHVRLPRNVVVPFILLGVLAIGGLANPSLPSFSVGLVGVRGWLFFAPLLYVGVRFAAEGPAAVLRLLRLALLAGVPVLVIGLLEALAFATGKGASVYAVYGSAAQEAFTNTGLRGAAVSLGSLHRVPSLFTYVAAYYLFCLAMMVSAYVLWRSGATPGIRRLGRFGFLLATVCALTSGSREALVTVPVIIVLTLVLDRGLPNLGAVIAAVVAFGIVAVVMRLPLNLPHLLIALGSQEGGDLIGHGFRVASSVTTLGLGPGTDTNASRNVGGSVVFDAIGGRWQESYFVKSWIELGIPGLLAVVWLMLTITKTLIRNVRGAVSARPLHAATTALFIAVVATSVKAAILDQAPANAYIWLFVGLALGAGSWADDVAPESISKEGQWDARTS